MVYEIGLSTEAVARKFSPTQVFSCEVSQIFKNTFSYRTPPVSASVSDFNETCITVMKMYYSKQKPSIFRYRKFKDFINDSFINSIKDLQTLLTKSFNEEAIPFQAFRKSVNVTLEKHARTKKRYARAN